MLSVGIKQLKNQLSRYVRLAAAGETVLVTDRAKVVASLNAPPTRSDDPDVAKIVDELVLDGTVTPARDRNRPLPTPLGGAKLAELLAELDADRDDRI